MEIPPGTQAPSIFFERCSRRGCDPVWSEAAAEVADRLICPKLSPCLLLGGVLPVFFFFFFSLGAVLEVPLVRFRGWKQSIGIRRASGNGCTNTGRACEGCRPTSQEKSVLLIRPGPAKKSPNKPPGHLSDHMSVRRVLFSGRLRRAGIFVEVTLYTFSGSLPTRSE